MDGLTPRQQACYEAILAAFRKRGAAPTLRELAEALGGIQINAVRGLVEGLVAKGWIVQGERGTSRNLRLGPRAEQCPLCGAKRVAGGNPTGEIEAA